MRITSKQGVAGMTIAVAEWQELLPVLHETYRIWSTGLSKSEYQQYIRAQMSSPWARRHYRHMVHKRAGKIVSSCKLYDLKMSARGSDFRVLAIGAVYTLEEHRGQGCATSLLEEVIALAETEGYDALMLYSEIGTDFYTHFGFEEMGSADFSLVIKCTREEELNGSEERTRFLQHSDIPFLQQHHARWLRRQPYGVVRTQEYWHFKLAKERYLQRHSRLSWPALELLTVNENGGDSGYMITEQSGQTVRLLELVGTDNARIELWKRLLTRAVAFGADHIRGWEGGVRDLAPSFSIAAALPSDFSLSQFEPLMYYDREWGVAMILPLAKGVEVWSTVFPCPLLELDHF
jgi:predicted N-acetyltransferase YhbS